VSTRANSNINAFDFGLLVVLLLCAMGFLLARAGHAGVDKVIEGTGKIGIDVFITGLKTKDIDLFKVGDKSAVTIRNQPVQPPMTIAKVEHNQKLVSFLSVDGKKALALPDPANPIAYDFLVTVVDEADRTADGYVVHGNKIKLGNQIELEGFKYRVQGVVVDIKAVP
jgi:Domain of unknown function (DUF4330)